MKLRVHKSPSTRPPLIRCEILLSPVTSRRELQRECNDHSSMIRRIIADYNMLQWTERIVSVTTAYTVCVTNSSLGESEMNRFRQKLTRTTQQYSEPKTVSCKFQLISNNASDEYQTKVSDYICKMFSVIFLLSALLRSLSMNLN